MLNSVRESNENESSLHSASDIGIGIVVAIALATIGGMVALWPKAETPTLKFIEGTPLNKTYSGEIFSMTTYECQLYATSKCQKVKLELTSGPDKGGTEELQVNTGGGLPEFAVGDEVRLVKNANATQSHAWRSRRQPAVWCEARQAKKVAMNVNGKARRSPGSDCAVGNQ
jgi:hypothetical protein